MREKRQESTCDTVVAEAFKAYRAVLARHDLLGLSRKEAAAALSSLKVGTSGRIDPRDVRFQAAIARLENRAGITRQALESILRELLAAEYDCDQAQWERDCHRREHMVHVNFRLMPRIPFVAGSATNHKPAKAR